ncbi:MAG: TetR/AcrR family transcriptional regulator [Dehalococcoidia bacterium]
MIQRLDWEHMPEVSDIRRRQILIAGRRVIERQGLDGFTIEDITKEVRVAKGTFYTYFASREVFLDALRAALITDVVDVVRTAAEGPWDDIFARIMRAVAAWLAANPALAGLFGSSYLARADRPTRESLFAVAARVIADGIAAGVFQPLVENADEGGSASAQLVYDALSAGVNRASSASPGAAPIEATNEFLQHALRFDADAARGRRWTPPPG